MTASNFHSKPSVPAAVADLDLALVAEVLARNGCNVSDAAAELHVPPSDLRRLMWSKPKLQDEAFEVVEGRIDWRRRTLRRRFTATIRGCALRRACSLCATVDLHSLLRLLE